MVGVEVEEFRVAFTNDTCVPAQLRGQFRTWLERQDVDRQDDWQLVLSELAANACHASPPNASIEVDARRTDDRVVVRVRNSSAGHRLPRVPDVIDPMALSGRGMFIVDQLTDGVVFEVDEGDVCVTCWIRLDV